MMLSLLLALVPASELPATTVSDNVEDGPVRLWMNSSRSYRPGDRVQVQVETGREGHLLVIHYAPDGRLKVLFPLEPGDDDFVRGGRRYEVKDPGAAQTFFADGRGPGLVFAALSEDPWRHEQALAAGAWDYGFFAIPADTEDPEAELAALVQRLSAPGGFDYDVLDYAVLGRPGDYADAPPVPRWWSPTYITIYNGYYDPWGQCWSCSYYGYWDPYPFWWTQPWGYYYGGYPYRYGGYRYRHFAGGWPWYPWSGGVVLPGRPARVPVIVGRPRGYTVTQLRPWTERARPGEAVVAGGFRTARSGDGSGRVTEANAPARRARERAGDEGRRPQGATVADRGREQPSGRPASRPESSAPPAARPADNSRQGGGQQAPARARPRGGRGGDEAAGVRSAPAAPPPARIERSTPPPARVERAEPARARARPVAERPARVAGPATRPAVESRPAAQPRPTAQSRPAAQPRPAVQARPRASRDAPRAAPAREPQRAASRPAPVQTRPAPAASTQRRPSGGEKQTPARPTRSRPRGGN